MNKNKVRSKNKYRSIGLEMKIKLKMNEISVNPLSASVALIESSQSICFVHQLTGFYMRATLALNGLIGWPGRFEEVMTSDVLRKALGGNFQIVVKSILKRGLMQRFEENEQDLPFLETCFEKYTFCHF